MGGVTVTITGHSMVTAQTGAGSVAHDVVIPVISPWMRVGEPASYVYGACAMTVVATEREWTIVAAVRTKARSSMIGRPRLVLVHHTLCCGGAPSTALLLMSINHAQDVTPYMDEPRRMVGHGLLVGADREDQEP